MLQMSPLSCDMPKVQNWPSPSDEPQETVEEDSSMLMSMIRACCLDACCQTIKSLTDLFTCRLGIVGRLLRGPIYPPGSPAQQEEERQHIVIVVFGGKGGGEGYTITLSRRASMF
jgi:hypothetical protein